MNCGPLSDTIMEGMLCVENSPLGVLWVQNDFWHRWHHVLNLPASFCKIDYRTFWHHTDVQTVAQHLVMLG